MRHVTRQAPTRSPLYRLQGANPPLIFLHEGLGCISMWRGFPDTLCRATGRCGLVVDRHGYGVAPPFPDPVRGGHPPDYHEREAAALIALLDDQAIDRAVLFGHSDGGTIALLAAARAPERILACITEAAHVFVEPVTLAGIRAAVAAYEAPASRLRAALLRHHGPARADKVFYRWADVWLSPAFAAWTVEHRLAAIRCPVLAIQGQEDAYGSPLQVRAIVDRIAGNGTPLMIDASGHAPHLDSETAVIEAVRALFERL